MPSFVFGTEPIVRASIRGVVPAGIETKAALMNAVDNALKLPDYFGRNWDALEECIRDLSWLPEGSIVLVHEDVPLMNDRASLRTYLSILMDAIRKWAETSARRLVVVFPQHAEEKVRRALSDPSPPS